MEHKILSTKKRLFIRDAFLTVQVGHQSEVPLHGQCGIDKERLVVIGVVDEIVGELPLGTDAEMLGEVIPKLGFGEDYQTTMSIGFLTTPEVDETSKTQLIVAEVQAPDAGQLSAGIRVGVVVALEKLLIQQLDGPCL